MQVPENQLDPVEADTPNINFLGNLLSVSTRLDLVSANFHIL
jgi:hypothetical protein